MILQFFKKIRSNLVPLQVKFVIMVIKKIINFDVLYPNLTFYLPHNLQIFFKRNQVQEVFGTGHAIILYEKLYFLFYKLNQSVLNWKTVFFLLRRLLWKEQYEIILQISGQINSSGPLVMSSGIFLLALLLLIVCPWLWIEIACIFYLSTHDPSTAFSLSFWPAVLFAYLCSEVVLPW